MNEMLISTKGRYALRMLLDIATHQGDGYVAMKDIAARQQISKKYLETFTAPLAPRTSLESDAASPAAIACCAIRRRSRCWT